MDLKRYRGEGGCALRDNQKRLKEKPENRFVIQKNQANGFYFDFKLEIKNKDNKNSGVHSWLIPKNIPLEPEVKRLAIKVDKEALNFNQEIDEKDIKEGRLQIWDKGRWGLMRGSLESGAISFNLFGEIVKARYTIQKLADNKSKNQKNHWVIWRVVGY
jgi:DNA ligase D-like protein (predicted 3'-phosphoesterase)